MSVAAPAGVNQSHEELTPAPLSPLLSQLLRERARGIGTDGGGQGSMLSPEVWLMLPNGRDVVYVSTYGCSWDFFDDKDLLLKESPVGYI